MLFYILNFDKDNLFGSNLQIDWIQNIIKRLLANSVEKFCWKIMYHFYYTETIMLAINYDEI